MSESVEEYLEAIYNFYERGQYAKNQDLAKRLNVSPPSVTEMVKKLSAEGLVVYEPYKGVMLTGKGVASAQKVVRKHRLLERFLYDVLGLRKEKVHAEACKLEHSLSDEASAALCASLNNPATCPDDGNPIPSCTLNAENCDHCKEAREKAGEGGKFLTQLSHLRPGEKGQVTFIRGGENATRRLMDMGLCVGTIFTVVNSLPFQGPMEISVRGTCLALGRGLADRVFVEVLNGESIELVNQNKNNFISK